MIELKNVTTTLDSTGTPVSWYTSCWMLLLSDEVVTFLCSIVVKGKAIPLQAWTGPQGSRSLRLAEFKTVGT
jgi:hypothetical protein